MMSIIITRWTSSVPRSIDIISRTFHSCVRSRSVLNVGHRQHPIHRFAAAGESCSFLKSPCHPSEIRCHCDVRPMSSFSYDTKKSNPVTPLFIKAEEFPQRTALIDQHGKHCYEDLMELTFDLGHQLGQKHGSLEGKAVCFLCENDISYVITKWAVWFLGGIAVPLCKSHPASELGYFIQDAQSPLVICTEDYRDKLEVLCQEQQVPLHVLDKSDYLLKERLPLDDSEGNETSGAEVNKKQEFIAARQNSHQQKIYWNQYKHQPSLIIYTSGTTGRPKGVVHTFGSIQAQIEDMVTTWEWSPSDVILHVLPLHHIHGVVNVLMTPLYVGATCVMLPKFDASQVWQYLLNPPTGHLLRSINLFMAVPTIYAKLTESFEQKYQRGRRTRKARDYAKAVCSTKIRLMVSGSAALPQPIMAAWEDLTGHRLLERYGMTEVGMALTNPLHGPRKPGCVGVPFPQVEVMIAKPNVYHRHGYQAICRGNHRHTNIMKDMKNEPGELMIRGPNVFRHYWQKQDATKETFTTDGWFKTGDTASYDEDGGVYKILGRTSVDVIKSGGYKISALDIERHLLSHPDINDVAVVGLPDLTWGQRVAVVAVVKPGAELTLDSLRTWCADRLPPYQVPTVMKVLESMPRNAMGKVNKKELLDTVFTKESRRIY